MVDRIGPFATTANSTSIAESIFELNNALQPWTEDRDILLVNRGFRDCIGSLEEAGFDIRMPIFLSTNEGSCQQ